MLSHAFWAPLKRVDAADEGQTPKCQVFVPQQKVRLLAARRVNPDRIHWVRSGALRQLDV